MSQQDHEIIQMFLPREDRHTSSLEVAHYWVKTYSDLIPLEENVLRHASELSQHGDETFRAAVEMSNLTPLRDLIATLKERRDYWQDRSRELAPGSESR
ncbi:MAG: hypothetical protein ABR573_05340 [Candidatus Dormibacteria bacterium]